MATSGLRRRRTWASRLAVLLLACACVPIASAHGYVTIGPSHDPDPATSQAINYDSPSVLFNVDAPAGVRLLAPISGVVTRWSLYTGDVSEGATLQLRVIAPEGGDNFRMVRSGSVETLAAARAQASLRSFAARVPILAGQGIGAGKTHPAGGALEVTLPQVASAPSPWKRGYFSPPPGDGSSGTATIQDNPGPGADAFFVLAADIEPDADGDLFGDDTQDLCAGSAGADRGCPPGALDPPPPEIVVNTVVPASALAQIDPASVALAANRKRLSLGVSCPVQASAHCAGKVRAKTARAVALPPAKRRRAILSLGRARFSIPQGESRTLRLRVPSRTRKAIVGLRQLKLTVTLSGSTRIQPTVP